MLRCPAREHAISATRISVVAATAGLALPTPLGVPARLHVRVTPRRPRPLALTDPGALGSTLAAPTGILKALYELHLPVVNAECVDSEDV